MTSYFGWIDHSEADRKKMLDAIDLFREQGTRDELGLSVIRDGFADLLFPGTGSQQRRARYFFFVAWMFQHFERERVRSSDITKRARHFEGRLIYAILAADDHDSAIGVRSREALGRMPSSIYWTGLRKLQIRLFPGSQDDYYRSLDASYRNASRQKNDDGELVDRFVPNWHSSLPPAPEGFESLATPRGEQASVPLTLEGDEADYLAARIRESVGDSVFAWFLNELAEASNVPFAWTHELSGRMPEHLRRQLDHARNFSEVMVGASILYNGMVCDLPPRRDAGCEEMQTKFTRWYDEITARSDALRNWNRHDFWAIVAESGARPSPGSRAFVDTWIDQVLLSAGAVELWNSADVRALIRNREWNLKKALAKLHSQHAREQITGYAGIEQMGFRWRDAELILNDILAARGRA